ncbi:MAG: CapA family protein [Chloroflexi bacterium]|nr:CapA family protein [Chloroflexota bacterium]
MNQETISLHAVGDVLFRRENPESFFSQVGPTLKRADILFGQTENIFAAKGAPQMHVAGSSVPCHPRKVGALVSAGFHVMSAASNHSLDFGPEPFLQSLDLLRKNGIKIVGAGKNIEEARQPAIVERKGVRIAFLGYCSVLPKGYEARPDKPGAAPLRATTAYEQFDWQAGMPPKILTFPNQEDLEAILDDVKKARSAADVVIVSMHWGVHLVPAVVAIYQKEAAHAVIDAGADMIIGHHTHILKGIEVYKGKVIFYSLGNFAIDGRPVETVRRDATWKVLGWELDPEYPTYPYPPDSRKTVIARVLILGKKITRVSYFPAMVNKQTNPEVLSGSDPRSKEVSDYVASICRDQRFDTTFTRDGDEMVVSV